MARDLQLARVRPSGSTSGGDYVGTGIAISVPVLALLSCRALSAICRLMVGCSLTVQRAGGQ